jgi:xanthine dehydrogenase accessory factor
MMAWLRALRAAQAAGEAAVLVTVAATRGSTPREAGAHLLVTAAAVADTLGGGRLEYRAIQIARAMLEADDAATGLQRFSLGASLGQCCGGALQLLFERVDPAAAWPGRLEQALRAGEGRLRRVGVERPGCALLPLAGDLCTGLVREDGRLWLLDPLRPPRHEVRVFGAGHVGSALVTLLAALDCRVLWVDDRPRQMAAAPRGVVTGHDPLAAVAEAPAGCHFVVMTHDHRLDERLAEAILRRGDFHWFGMIGSRSKRARFEHRLRQKGLDPGSLTRMICPIGIDGISSKRPQAIALAVAAQLQRDFEARPWSADAREAG